MERKKKGRLRLYTTHGDVIQLVRTKEGIVDPFSNKPMAIVRVVYFKIKHLPEMEQTRLQMNNGPHSDMAFTAAAIESQYNGISSPAFKHTIELMRRLYDT